MGTRGALSVSSGPRQPVGRQRSRRGIGKGLEPFALPAFRAFGNLLDMNRPKYRWTEDGSTTTAKRAQGPAWPAGSWPGCSSSSV